MSIFETIFGALNKARIEYLVVGGVAVNIYGHTRFTGDLDILALLEEKNLEKLGKAMKKLGYSERLPVSIKDLKDQRQVKKWLKEKNLKAYSFVPPMNNLLTIDIIIEESLKFEKIEKNKMVTSFGRIKIPVISIDDLIKMKRKSNRVQDVEDLKNLIKLKNI